MAPTSVMTTLSTVAKIGRSMKNRDSMVPGPHSLFQKPELVAEFARIPGTEPNRKSGEFRYTKLPLAGPSLLADRGRRFGVGDPAGRLPWPARPAPPPP